MKQIKLIAIDIDGTLVNSQKQITLNVKKAIFKAKKAGKKIVICTGRPLSGAQQYLDELELNNHDTDYIVSFNGAVVETTNGRVLFKQGLTYKNYVDLEAVARKLNLHFHAVSLDRIYTANRDLGYYTIYNSRVVKLGVSYRTQEEMKKISIIKCMYVDQEQYLDSKIKSSVFDQLRSHLTFSKTEPFYYEVTASNVNKGAGLRRLCEYLKIDSTNVMALGDQANDVSMIKYAGLGIAMGNAVEITKKSADQITLDCDHDGVAEAINNFI